MMRPTWINKGKPPLLVEHVRSRGPGRNAEALLLLDNVLAAHGRMPFTGARRILLAMT